MASEWPTWILPVLAALAYLGSFDGDFQFDDYNVIVFNQAVHSLQGWWSGMPGIRPLLKLSYTLNWISSPAPWGFHAVNLALHMGCTALVWRLLREFAPTATHANEAAVTRRTAWIGAALFALHPVQTEAVTYISGRSVSLMAFFYLSALWAYIQGRLHQDRRMSWGVSSALFLLALAVRETAITLPLALLMWEIWRQPVDSRWPWRSWLFHMAPQILVLGLGLAAILAHPVYRELLSVSLHTRDVPSNLGTQLHGVGYLFSRLLLPHRLCIDPDLPARPLEGEGFFLLAAAWLLSAALAGWQWRQRRWLALGLLWFLLHLAPTNSGLARLDVANERHLYLASIGIFAIAGRAWCTLLPSGNGWPWPRCGHIAGAMTLAALFGFTVQRNAVYEYQLSLWQATAQCAPDKARVHNNLGFAYATEGELSLAKKHYLMALALEPDNALARNNLARLNQGLPP